MRMKTLYAFRAATRMIQRILDARVPMAGAAGLRIR
jgi:hypothetical protein